MRLAVSMVPSMLPERENPAGIQAASASILPVRATPRPTGKVVVWNDPAAERVHEARQKSTGEVVLRNDPVADRVHEAIRR